MVLGSNLLVVNGGNGDVDRLLGVIGGVVHGRGIESLHFGVNVVVYGRVFESLSFWGSMAE
jgi:hypothetical protein